MRKHVDIVHEKKKSFKCELCDYNCGQKGDMKKHVAIVHEKKKPFKWNMFIQLMIKINNSNVRFATNILC